MNTESYNGWYNRETWLINVWLGDYLQELADEGHVFDPDGLEDTVHELIEVPTEGILADLCGINRVDWVELAAHYNEE
jgi:hypothetical protein